MRWLQCLYMLLTRVPPTEEDAFKDAQKYTLFEKIKSKVNYYGPSKQSLSSCCALILSGVVPHVDGSIAQLC